MGDGTLSQAEIDALMQGADSAGAGSGGEAAAGGSSLLSDGEVNQLKTVASEMGPKYSEPLTGNWGKTVTIGNPTVQETPVDTITSTYGSGYVQVTAKTSGDVSGTSVFLIPMQDALMLGALSMQEDVSTPPTELDDVHLSALNEMMNLMFSSGLTAVKSKYDKSVEAAQPQINVINSADDLTKFGGESAAQIIFDFSVEGVINTQIIQLLDKDLTVGLSRLGVSAGAMSFDMGDGENLMDSFDDSAFDTGGGSQASAPAASSSSAQEAQFQQLGQSVEQEQPGNIGLLMDVPMNLTVELGRTSMMVKKILELGEGSIIELDKLAGEPVDLLVNGKLIAKGEVVVIDENFGIRITDIISQAERLKAADR